MEPPNTSQLLDDLPLDIIKLVAQELVYLSSAQFTRLLLVSKSPFSLIQYLPELDFPAHLTQRHSAFESLRVGPFFTRQAAIDQFWSIPTVKFLRHMNLLYMNITKPILQVLDACAPTLLTLRLTGSSGAYKFWESTIKFPHLQVFDCWGHTFPSQESVDDLLKFVTNQCGTGLKEFHMSGKLPYNSFKRTTPPLVPCDIGKLTQALLPHCKTLEFIRVRISPPWSVREFTDALNPFVSIKRLEYPLSDAVARCISNDGSEISQLQSCLAWIDSFSQQISDTSSSNGLGIHSLVESVGPDASVRSCSYGLYDIILRRLDAYNWQLSKDHTFEFLTKELPRRGFRPTSMSYQFAFAAIAPGRLHDNNNVAQENTTGRQVNSLIKYFAIDCDADVTVPVPFSRTKANALHLGLSYQVLTTALLFQGVTLPKWLENSTKISQLRDSAGRCPLMYRRIREHHLNEKDTKAPEVLDSEGNSIFHYIMSEYIFETNSWTNETLSLARTIERLNSIQPKNIEGAINHYGVSAHSLLASSLSHPLKALTRMAPLPHINKSYWTSTSVEEPIFTRLIAVRVSLDELQTSQLTPLLKQVLQTASKENLNVKVYGPKHNLPFLHAAVEAEAVWVFKVLLEIPDTWNRIDMNALDYMGRTALHVAVAPRKDSVFPTSELLKILLNLGMSPTILDKNGWTAAMRVSANKECLKIIAGYLTDEEKKTQSALFLAKQQASKDKRQ